MAVVIVLFFFFILIGLPIGVTLGVAGLLQIGGENFLTMAPKRFLRDWTCSPSWRCRFSSWPVKS
jgi:hypothetical protein